MFATDSVEKSLKKSKIDAKIAPTDVFHSMMSGANEEIIVNTGLEYSMTNACLVSWFVKLAFNIPVKMKALHLFVIYRT